MSSGIWIDVRHAARVAARRRLASTAIVITSLLGVGAVTAIASVLSSVLLEPLPLPGPERLVRVSSRLPDAGIIGAANPLDLEDWRSGNGTFAALGAIDPWGGASLVAGGQASWVAAAYVDAAFADVLGVRPVLGRWFAREEYAPGACATTGRVCPSSVVMLSHGLWQREFGGARTIVGRTIHLDGQPRTIARSAAA